MLKKSLISMLFFSLLIFSVSAQETESVTKSNLTKTSLPANAHRVLSIPAEVSTTLEKLVAGGAGKVRQGETEVLVWTGEEYQKAGANGIINRITDALKAAGWKYQVSGTENGVTVFGVLQSGKNRQGLIGFYGESDGVLVFAWTEVFPTDLPLNSSQNTEKSEVGSSAGIVGTWDNGRVSTISRQNTITGAVSPGGGSRFEYQFTANGKFQFTGLMTTTNYSCTDTLFNEKAGSYTLAGSTLTLIPSKNYWKKTNSCNSGGNSEKNHTLAKEIYQFSNRTNEYGQELICLDNGSGEACYRKKQ